MIKQTGMPELPNLGTERGALGINGVQVIKNDWLPHNTMMVSPDVYERLTETPEQQAQKFAMFKAQVDNFQGLLKRRGLSPTGRKLSEPQLQELPKCCVPTADEEALLAAGDCTPEELWGGLRPTCPKCINNR